MDEIFRGYTSVRRRLTTATKSSTMAMINSERRNASMV
jgi:hypothetical protein